MLHLITFKISGKAVSRLYQVQSGSWAALKELLPAYTAKEQAWMDLQILFFRKPET